MALATDLIAYWPMDAASGNEADSVGSSTLAETSGTIASAAGKIGNCRDFEAGDTEYFSCADSATLSTGDIDFSVAAWVHAETLSNFPVIAHKSWGPSGSDREWALYYDTGASRFTFEVQAGGATQAVAANGFGAATTGVWYHAVAWHDSVNNVLGISVNGVATTASYSGGVADGTGPFEVGASPTQTLWWDGLIDEVAFWKKVLTADERIFLYNSGIGRTYAEIQAGISLAINLVAAWELNESSGNALDSKGSNTLTETSGTIATGTGLIYSTARDFELADTEYFSITDNVTLSMGAEQDFTLECWLKAESLPTDFHGILGKCNGNAGSLEYWLFWDGVVNSKFRFGISGNGTTDVYVTAATPAPPSTGTWYQIIAYHDGVANTIGISANGATPSTASHSSGAIDGANPFKIGIAFESFGAYWDGLIGPVRLWKRLLSSAERTELYNSGAGRTYSYISGVAAFNAATFPWRLQPGPVFGKNELVCY